MSSLHFVTGSIVTALALTALSGEARAQDPPAAGSAGAPAPAAAPAVAPATGEVTPANPSVDKDNPDAPPEDDPFRSIAITANPLSLILTRIGVNIEWLPTTHHAVVVNPFGQFASAGAENEIGGKSTYTNFGGEVGYRFYTGTRGANGFFVGPFVTLLTSSATTTTVANGAKQEASSSFLAYGGGLDLGGQHVFKNGFTIGGGVGAMYLAASASTGASSSTIKFEGVLPRFLFTAGYSF